MSLNRRTLTLGVIALFLTLLSYPGTGQDIDSVLYLNGKGSRVIDTGTPPATSNAITISSWIKPQNSNLLNRTETIISKGTQASVTEFSNLANWEIYNATNEDGRDSVRGFVGGVFDGRYVYYSPWWAGDSESGRILRYDTKKPYGDTDSWDVYDAENQNGTGNVRGLEGAVFDGRYVYFVPLHHGPNYFGTVLRYDTHADFLDPASWVYFESETIDPESKGFVGAVFDGTYVYFVPGSFEAHNTVLRLNTKTDFHNPASWETYNLASMGSQYNGIGFFGGIFDGRYIYYVPFSPDGTVVRFDTKGDFHEASSWSSVGITQVVQGNTRATFCGAAFDGRYVYFSSYIGGKIVRLDTKGSFTSMASWTYYEILNFDGLGDVHGGVGPTFDGRFVYFPSMYKAGGRSGKFIAYDTFLDFNSKASWNVIDMSNVDPQLTGFEGSVFDGQYVYFLPMNFGNSHAKIPRYNTMPHSSFSYSLEYTRSSSSFGSVTNKPAFRVGTTLGVRSVYAVGDKNLADGRWHHIAATYDGTSMKLYIDGALNNENIYDENADINASDESVIIGNQVNAKNHGYAGLLNELGIWDSALDPDDIKEVIGNSGMSGNLAEPVAYWTFDDGSETALVDLSGADFDLALYVGADETICPTGAAMSLTDFYPAGGKWTGNGITADGVLTPSVSLAGTTQVLTYSLIDWYETIPHTFSGQKQITFKAVPQIQKSQDAICANGGVTLSVDSEFSQYAWSSGETSSTLSVTTPGQYSVVVTDAENCQLPSPAVNIAVTAAPTIAKNGVTIESSIDAPTYDWFVDEEPLSVNSKAILPATEGNYRVRVTDSNGCQTFFSESHYYEGLIEDVVAYPNPSEGVVNLVTSRAHEKLRISVLNQMGQEVVKPEDVVTGLGDHFQIDLSAHEDGIYMVRVITPDGEFVHKVAKMR